MNFACSQKMMAKYQNNTNKLGPKKEETSSIVVRRPGKPKSLSTPLLPIATKTTFYARVRPTSKKIRPPPLTMYMLYTN